MSDDATYVKIAHDITEKIISGEFPEGTILKGRSLLASIYNVSPETIRKAIQILAQEKILYVKHGVGVFVDSINRARKYQETWEAKTTLQNNSQYIKTLLEQAKDINDKISSAVDVLQNSFRFQSKEAISFFEVVIDPTSWVCNKTIGEVYFWNYTEATIVAILRHSDGLLQVSPGPDMPLLGLDKIIFVGKDELSYERVLTFLKYGVEE